MSHINLINELNQRFSAAGVGNARRTAEELIAHALDCGPLEIYLRDEPPAADQLHSIETLAARIEGGEPLQYVIGHVDFMGLEIRCDPRALIPRPETEQLVETVLASTVWGQAGSDPSRRVPRIVDVGTGTGCIVLALAHTHPEAEYVAADASAAALALARENAGRHGLESKIQWRENHLLDGFPPESCDAVVANLPYIASGDWQTLSPSVRNHEPQCALDSGPTGLELIEALAIQARTALRPGGMLFLEFGFDQGKAVERCLSESGYLDVRILQDLSGHDRMATAVNPQPTSFS
jgi:release factor glutamine methyltransferase